MEKYKILAIVGSLRKDSYNRQLALKAKEAIGNRADFELLDYLDVPFFNQDIEFPTPGPVKRVREKVILADGIWFFTPEYNHSVPGALKNLIDWLSRPQGEGKGQVLAKKPAAISGITPGMTGTCLAQDHLVKLISLLNMDIMNYPRLTIPNLENQLDENGRLSLSSSHKYLERQVNAFLDFIKRRKELKYNERRENN